MVAMMSLPIAEANIFELPDATDFSCLSLLLPQPVNLGEQLSPFHHLHERRTFRSPVRSTVVQARRDGFSTPPRSSRALLAPPAPRLARSRDDDLEEALDEGFVALVEAALLRGSACRCSEHKCFHEAVRRMHSRSVTFLLSEDVSAVNDTCGGRRLLDVALAACNRPHDEGYKVAEALLASGACTDSLDGTYSALRIAAGRANTAAVSLLLAHGADPNAADENGMAPLHYLCQQARCLGGPWCMDIARRLLEHGASPVHEDFAGARPRVYAAAKTRDLFLRAEKRWNYCLLVLARGRGVDARQGITTVLFVPELFDAIAEFV